MAKDTQFKIVSVVEPLSDEYEDDGWHELKEQIARRRKAAAEERCQKARLRLAEHIASSSVHFELREGDVCCQLLDAASHWNADKILVGAHSRSTCPHSLLGSVSRALSEHAPCSVEVIRDRAAAGSHT